MIETCVLGLWLAAALPQEGYDDPTKAPPAEALVPPPPKATRIIVGRVTRLGDPVAYLDTEAQAERMLFFWEKSHPLRIGDGVRNGGSGFSLIRFDVDGSEIYLWGESWVMIESAGPEERVLVWNELTRAKVDVRGSEMRFRLPGDVELVARNTSFRLYRDDFRTRFRIENAGPGEVSVSGPVVPTDVAAVMAGERLLLPIRGKDPDSARGAGLISTETVRVWRGHEVRLEAGVRFRTTPGHLILEGEGTARVGGARLRIADGRHAQIWTPQR